MSPGNGDGPRCTRRPAENTTPVTATAPVAAHRTATAAIPVVAATRLRAVAGARRDRALVRRCVWCMHAHVHVVYEDGVESFERSPRCHPRRRYMVRIVDVLPAAVVGGRRRAA